MSAARGLARRLKHHNPLDGLRPYWPNLPARENKYTPAGPVLGGRAKCEKKGHRPLKDQDWVPYCTRCKEAV